MATPPTRVLDVTPAVGWTSTASPKTTPTFDVQTGDLLVYVAFSEDSSHPIGAPTWTGTGTWTLQQSVVVGNYCTAYLYTCAVTATATGRTVSAARTSGSGQFSFIVSVWRNHGGVGVSGKANVASGAPSLVLNAAANSALVAGNSDWNALDGASRTWRTVNGSPITESSYGHDPVHYTAYTGYRSDVGAAGNETVGLTAPAGQKYSIVGVEVLGTTGGGAVSADATRAVTAALDTSASRGTLGAVSRVITASLTAAALVSGIGQTGLPVTVTASAEATISNGIAADATTSVAVGLTATGARNTDVGSISPIAVAASGAVEKGLALSASAPIEVTVSTSAQISSAGADSGLSVVATPTVEAALNTGVSSSLTVAVASTVEAAHVGMLVPIQSVSQWLDSIERPLAVTIWDGVSEVAPTSVSAVRL